MVDQLAELSLFDASVGSLAELNDLPLMTGLRSLNLHANRVSQIGQHLERQTPLELGVGHSRQAQQSPHKPHKA